MFLYVDSNNQIATFPGAISVYSGILSVLCKEGEKRDANNVRWQCQSDDNRM